METTTKRIKTILIADENPGLGRFTRLLLPEHKGYRVVTTSSGVDAILKTKEIKPDILLADVSLSDKDGYEVSREIKNDPLLKSTSVILFVELLGVFDEIKAAESCADDFIMKPLKPNELAKKIEFFISQSEKREITSEPSPEAQEVSKKEALAGVGISGEKIMEEKESQDYSPFEKKEENDEFIKKIELVEGAKSEEEIIPLEGELRENEPDTQSVTGEIEVLASQLSLQITDKVSQIIIKLRPEIVDKITQAVIKKLNEIIPKLVSQVVDSAIKEEIKKIKKS